MLLTESRSISLSNRKMSLMMFVVYCCLGLFVITVSSNSILSESEGDSKSDTMSHARLVSAARRSRLDMASASSTTSGPNTNTNNNYNDNDDNNNNHIKNAIEMNQNQKQNGSSFKVTPSLSVATSVSSLSIRNDQSTPAIATGAAKTTTPTTPSAMPSSLKDNPNAGQTSISTKDNLRATILNEKKNNVVSDAASSILSNNEDKANDTSNVENVRVTTNFNSLDNQFDQLPDTASKEMPSSTNFEEIDYTDNDNDSDSDDDDSSSASSSVSAIVSTSSIKVPNTASNNNLPVESCDAEMLTFEIVTGYVFSAPGKMLDSLPGTLMLTDCLEACQANETCRSINYETGLCVLFSANADQLSGALTKSQFPVFTIYAQKSCLGVRPCARAWCVDRVQNYKLNGHAKRSIAVQTRRDCFELCLAETEFTCRSANYHRATNTCELCEMDRITLAGTSSFQPNDGYDYLENNCAEEPNKLCEFKRLSGRILKTVDSVYQDVASIDECRDLCINSPYRCHSYDFGDTGDMVCRLSHHSRATLSDVQEPYLEVPEAATYELASCYNVTIECGAGDMIARIRTSKLFDGKVYAKGSPKSCAYDVDNSLEFELRMGYQDLECNVRQQGMGRYMNDVVIQHHDTIVTSSDLGLAVTCQYDLTNKSVTNDVDLNVKGDIEPALSEEVIVDSPNVIMKITSRDGLDVMRSAEVGDPLALKFEILDEHSPYEIFVRELVAMDGTDNAEITLIDSNGCPTDHFIMGPIYKSTITGKILLSHFDAFKFPSSELVQFRALITPCMPSCNPIQCNQEDISGEHKSLLSFGRRRRRRSLHNNNNSTGTLLIDNDDGEMLGRDEIELKNSKKIEGSSSSSSWGISNGVAEFTHRNNNKKYNKNIKYKNNIKNTDNNNNNIKNKQRIKRDAKQKPSQEDLLLVQSIQITDKFGFDRQQQHKQQLDDMKTTPLYDNNETVFIANDLQQGFCINTIGLIVAGTVFLLTQLAVIAVWTYLYQRRRKLQPYSNEDLSNGSSYGSHGGSTLASSSTIIGNLPTTRTESLCKLYDGSNFQQRHGRQF